jgi:5-methylcytosine-specific restriction enzyme A
MRQRVSEFQKTLPAVNIKLGSDARLPGDYAAGHAIGITYSLNTLPNEGTLQAVSLRRRPPCRISPSGA